jgi:FAD/FMN-containing dehydrogenase
MIEALIEIFSSNRVKTDADSLAQWGRDWTRSFKVAPTAVVFPETTEELVSLVRLAAARGIALVPSGGRTGLSGGAVAGNGEVVVSFDRMNRILGFDPADRIARCQAGVVTEVCSSSPPTETSSIRSTSHPPGRARSAATSRPTRVASR